MTPGELDHVAITAQASDRDAFRDLCGTPTREAQAILRPRLVIDP